VEQVESEERWRRADGSTIWVQASTSVATDADGLPLRVGTAHERCLIRQVVDITARRVAEATLASTRTELERRNTELQRSNDELSEFGYVVSHDLSEPLRVIAGHVQLLAARYGDRLGRDADEWIAFAVDGCTRMRTLIDDLLDYSRAGRDLQNRRPVDAQRVASDACAALAAAIDEAGAIVEVGELPTVHADATQLGQIFTNLIGNAIKFRRAGVRPHVVITAREDEAQWHFTVSDNGIGIPERHRERVFKLFQKLAPPGEYSGTGIGLAICRKVVEHFGGRIWIEDAPEGGSAFHFTVPQQG
jgi:light-regulated signal transduction histidine kinase (bacteriophytochrome)